MIEAIIKYNYMQNAVLVAILSSIICGIIGTIIVEKKLVSMSGGIAHASFGGIGAGYFFKIEPIIGGLIFGLMTSLGVANIKRKTNAYPDTIVNMFWAAGMALGILFISLTPGYPPDMTSYLFGDILSVNDLYLKLIFAMAILTFFVVFSLLNYLKIYLFDEEYAKIMGINVVFLEFILYSMIALSIVLLIKVVGVILSIAMLTIPPTISKLFTNRLKNIMILSSFLGMFFCMLGLTISYYVDIPSGATIILISIIIYFLSLFLKRHN